MIRRVDFYSVAAVALGCCCIFGVSPSAAEPSSPPESWSDYAPPLADIEFNFRVDALSDLIERGISRTRHQPTPRGVATVDWGIFYLSGSAYRIDTGPLRSGDELEAELAAGVSDRRGPFFYDLNFAQGFSRTVNDQYTEFDLRLTYDLGARVTAVGFGGYAPDEYGQEIVWGGTGLRLKITRDLIAFSDVGDAHYFSGIIPDYQYWRAGLDYGLNDWTTVGIAYHGTTLNTRECALVAESLLGSSCDAGVMGRLSFWFDQTDLREVWDRAHGSRQPENSTEPPPLEVLAAKLPHSRINNDDDPW